MIISMAIAADIQLASFVVVLDGNTAEHARQTRKTDLLSFWQKKDPLLLAGIHVIKIERQ